MAYDMPCNIYRLEMILIPCAVQRVSLKVITVVEPLLYHI